MQPINNVNILVIILTVFQLKNTLNMSL